jgi:ribosomal-protein-alanine N-acetyltransferase
MPFNTSGMFRGYYKVDRPPMVSFMMMKHNAMTIDIQPYKEDDYPQLLKLFSSNSPAYFASEEIADFKRYLKNEREDYYVVKVVDVIVGCGGINYDTEEKTAVISWDIIDPSFQGHGIGSALLQYRLGLLEQNNKIEKIVVRTSQHTYLYYEKNNFYTVQVEKDYWAVGFDLYLMNYRSNN